MHNANKNLVLRIHDEVWNRGNAAVIEELYAPDFEAHYPGGFSWSGHEGTRRALAELRAAFPDWTETVDEILAEGDRVVTRFHSRGTHRGTFLGVEATNRVVTLDEMALFRIADGRLAEQWGCHDMLGLLRQLGAVPEVSEGP
jgi:steroid delta-isomerase-like uncharacterized protein